MTSSDRALIVSPHALTVGEIRRRLIALRDDLAGEEDGERLLGSTGDSLLLRLDREIVALRELQRRIVEETRG